MTVYDVDTQVYTDAGHALITAADNFFAAVDTRWTTLADCTAMAGSYDDAKAWAADYDTQANDLIDQTLRIAQAANNYGCILLELGYLHEVADHNAAMTPGPPPAEPAYPELGTRMVCHPPLPSAGGPGNGLTISVDAVLSEITDLLDEVGVIIPDGDTTKLGTAADTWAQIAAAAEVAGFAGEIDRIAGLFAAITAPELAHIDEDLRAIKTAADQVTAGYTAISASAAGHRDGLVAMRAEIKDFLEGMVADIALEIAVTAAVTVVASLVTFGAASPVGAAIAAGRLATIVRRWAPKIKRGVDTFKHSKALAKVSDAVPDFVWSRQEMQRLLDLANKRGPRARGSSWDLPNLTDADRRALQNGPWHNGQDLTRLLRSGQELTPDQQKAVADLNAALSKLPAHEGPVVRHTTLSPEDLARYEPGKPTTELGFTSTSNRPGGVQEQFVHNAEVEFQIVSKNGRVYTDPDGGGPFGTPDEILFPSGTPFFVHNKFFDPATGKIVIQMSQI